MNPNPKKSTSNLVQHEYMSSLKLKLRICTWKLKKYRAMYKKSERKHKRTVNLFKNLNHAVYTMSPELSENELQQIMKAKRKLEEEAKLSSQNMQQIERKFREESQLSNRLCQIIQQLKQKTQRALLLHHHPQYNNNNNNNNNNQPMNQCGRGNHYQQNYEEKDDHLRSLRSISAKSANDSHNVDKTYQILLGTLRERQKHANKMYLNLIDTLSSKRILLDINEKVYRDEMNLLVEWLHKPREELKEYIQNMAQTEQELTRRFDEQTYKEIRSEYKNYPKMIEITAKSHRKSINKYSDIQDFANLNLAKEIYQNDFKQLLDSIQLNLKRKGIVDVECTGVKLKSIQRSFHKIYYDYRGNVSKLTDILRTSFIFNHFRDMFNAVFIIDQLTEEGILRYKNTFDEDHTPSGWRQILLNVKCPNSQLICEIQLHISNLQQYHSPTHHIYRIRRLFQHPNGNYFDQFAQQVLFKTGRTSSGSRKSLVSLRKTTI